MLEAIFILAVILGVIIAARRTRETHKIPPSDEGRASPPPDRESPYAKAVALRRAKHAEQKRLREQREQREQRQGGRGRKKAGKSTAKPFRLHGQSIVLIDEVRKIRLPLNTGQSKFRVRVPQVV